MSVEIIRGFVDLDHYHYIINIIRAITVLVSTLSRPSMMIAIAISSISAAYCYCNGDHEPLLCNKKSKPLKKGQKFYYMINRPDGTATQTAAKTGVNNVIGVNKTSEGSEVPNTANTLFPGRRERQRDKGKDLEEESERKREFVCMCLCLDVSVCRKEEEI